MCSPSLVARALLTLGCLAVVGPVPAADVATTAFPIAGGSLSLEAPEGFERVEPKSGMIEAEFAVPSAGDLPAGRMTVMGAGGSIEANIDRWCGQFTQPDGGQTKEKMTKKSVKVAGCGVTLVDIPGTFLDQPGGPFAGGPTVQRPGYRMLAAIVETPEQGNSFLKFYGPAATVERHAAGFQKMIEGMVPAGR
jgi:hypothetical protein